MELSGQVISFAMTIGTGILLGSLFDCYRVLRGAFAPKAVMTWFADLFYWGVATAVVFISLVLSNWGELRFYVVIGILSGVTLYYKCLSHYLIRLFAQGIRLLIIGVGYCKSLFVTILIRPFLYCMKILSWPFHFIWKQLVVWCHTRWIRPPNDEKK